MKRLLTVLKALVVVVVVAVCGVAIYVVRTWDRTYDVPEPAIQVSTDPAVIRRGEYIVFGPAHCVECHVGSAVEARTSLEGGRRPPLTGGQKFPLGPLGVVYSKNLTPDPETGIGRYTDGQIARMMRWAVRPDGRASIPPMMRFGDMSDEDMICGHLVSARAAAGAPRGAGQPVDADGKAPQELRADGAASDEHQPRSVRAAVRADARAG
jgi:hypothetical protein